jgi:hypothetical protein
LSPRLLLMDTVINRLHYPAVPRQCRVFPLDFRRRLELRS